MNKEKKDGDSWDGFCLLPYATGATRPTPLSESHELDCTWSL